QFDAVAGAEPAAGGRDFAVHLHFAAGDALFQRAARAQAGLGQDLVQALLGAAAIGGIGLGALERQEAAGFLGHAVCSGRTVSVGPWSVWSPEASGASSFGSPPWSGAWSLGSSSSSCSGT